MTLAETILARAWRRAQSRNLQKEGFLEDGLAAALEAPGVWERLVAHLGWSGIVSSVQPEVTSQDCFEEGRTDILLTWENGYRLALELKVNEPPSQRQIKLYLQSGVDVVAISRNSASIEVEEPTGRRFLGVVPWSRIRELTWEGAPLPLTQLHHLLDVTEVAMPRITEQALTGLLASWNIWNALESWSFKGMEAVQTTLKKGEFICAFQGKKGEHVKVDVTHQRLVWWIFPLPWRSDALAVYGGLFMGRPGDPVSASGFPDLHLALHVQPDSHRGLLLRKDETLKRAVEKWKSRAEPLDCKREFRSEPGAWEPLRCRSSSKSVAQHESDQGLTMITWMEERAKEWVEDGIAGRLAELSAAPTPT
jgi:hypothetical protein